MGNWLTGWSSDGSPGGSPGWSSGGSPGGSPGWSSGGSPGWSSGGSPGWSSGGSPGWSPGWSSGGSPGWSSDGSPDGSPGWSSDGSPGGSPGWSSGGSPDGSPGWSSGSSPGWSPGWSSGCWSSGVPSVPAHKLEEYIHANLKPNKECLKKIDQAVDAISDILRNSEIPVERVAKGGSYGRKTVLRGSSDGTLVLFMGHFHRFQDQTNQQMLLNEIQRRLKHHEKYKNSVNRGDSLQVSVSIPGQSILLDLHLAFDPLGFSVSPSSWVYRDLKKSMDQVQASPGEFAVCFTTLQEQFFKKYPSKLKDLILLVKRWYQECQKKWIASPPPSSLYALELLTVYAWEQGCQAEDFDIAEGVRTVLQLIGQPTKLCVYWMVYYNFEDETVRNTVLHQLKSQRPVILDPTDPTNNVGKDAEFWELREEADAWLYSLSLNEVSPEPCWNVLPMSLFVTPSHFLDKFIQEFLQPDKDFLEQIKGAVDVICSFLKENCFRHLSTIKVLKTVKGGSTAKGTALKNGSDADIVLFLSSLDSYATQKTKRSLYVQEIRKQLDACQQAHEWEVKFEPSKWEAPRVLSFTLKSKILNESVEFDVLPAYDALGQLYSGFTSRPEAYKELIELCASPDFHGGEFSTCFTELQRKFIETRPTKLKSLIRLVKHWYKQCERKLKPKASLPPKYALELLTVYAWEQGSGMNDFNTAEGFRTVLDLVIKYQQLCIFWTVNYNFEEEPIRTFLLTQIRKKRPVILDPADPTGDVGGGDRWCWNCLAKEAKEWLASLCFELPSRDFEVGRRGLVQPWKVPVVQTPGSCGAQIYPTVGEVYSV